MFYRSRPRSNSGNKKVIVMSDYFTRYMVAAPIKDEKRFKIAEVLLLERILRYGLPEKILNDRGK